MPCARSVRSRGAIGPVMMMEITASDANPGAEINPVLPEDLSTYRKAYLVLDVRIYRLPSLGPDDRAIDVIDGRRAVLILNFRTAVNR